MISGVSNMGDLMDNLASSLFNFFFLLARKRDLDWRQWCLCTPGRDTTSDIGLTPTHHNKENIK